MGRLPENVSYCRADFNKQSLEEIGVESNIDFSAATTIVWEGVTNYLNPRAVDATFRWAEEFSRVNVIFTYLDKKVLDHPEEFAGTRNVLRYLRDNEEQWTFGFAPQELPDYLGQHHLTLVEDVGAADYRTKYMAGRARLVTSSIGWLSQGVKV